MVYTVSDAIEKLGFGNYQRRIYLLCGLHTLASGMQMLLLSLIQSQSKCELNYSQEQAALINSSVGIGFLVGSLFWGIFADSFGRYPALLLSTLASLSFGIGSAFADTHKSLLLLRGLAIFGVGGSVVSFSLAMEFLPKSARGWACPVFGCFWPSGVCILYASAIFIMPNYGWRALIVFGSLPAGIFLLTTVKLSESPTWLISANRTDEALLVLTEASESNSVPLPSGSLVLSHEEPGSENENRSKAGIASFVRPRILSLSLKLCVPWFVTAFAYYGSVLLQPEIITMGNIGKRCSYADKECRKNNIMETCTKTKSCSWKEDTCLFEATKGKKYLQKTARIQGDGCEGRLTTEDYISSLISSAGELSGLTVPFLLIENIGRRGVLFYSYVISSIVFMLLFLCGSKETEMWFFFVIRGMGSCFFNSIYQITGELFPAEIRSTAIGLFSAVCRVGLILTPTVAQIVSAKNLNLAVAIYAVSCLAAAIATVSIPIETAKRSMLVNVDELDSLLAGNENNADLFESFKNHDESHLMWRLLRIPAKFDRTVRRPINILP